MTSQCLCSLQSCRSHKPRVRTLAIDPCFITLTVVVGISVLTATGDLCQYDDSSESGCRIVSVW